MEVFTFMTKIVNASKLIIIVEIK